MGSNPGILGFGCVPAVGVEGVGADEVGVDVGWLSEEAADDVGGFSYEWDGDAEGH